jgi:hypothetical protein
MALKADLQSGVLSLAERLETKDPGEPPNDPRLTCNTWEIACYHR